jgi:hypothetical protein
MLRVIFAVALLATYAMHRHKHELDEERKKNVDLQLQVNKLYKKQWELNSTVDVLMADKRMLLERIDDLYGQLYRMALANQ